MTTLVIERDVFAVEVSFSEDAMRIALDDGRTISVLCFRMSWIKLVSDWFFRRCIMETVGVYEAKTHLAQLLERVAKGERITITKHGVPVAILLPADSSKRIPVRECIAQLKEFRKGRRLDGLSIREMIEEGRD